MKKILSRGIPLLLLLALAACAPARVAEKKVVQVTYTLTVDGAVVDQSQPDQPLEFMVGAQKMIPAFETEIMGLEVGEKKSFLIKAADGYGEYDKAKLIEVPLDQFPEDAPPKVGDRFTVPGPQGEMQISIAAVSGKTVTVDFNFALAGKDLNFDIEVVKLRDATKDELATLATAAQAAPQ